jgi:hypothetical protein
MAMVAAIGLGLQVASGIASGIQEGQAAEYNAKQATENARLARENSQEEARMQNVFSRKVLGQMRADVGASGLRFEGSAKDVYAASAAEAERDYRKILSQGEAQARGYEGSASLYSSRAASAPWAGAVSAAGTLFSGGAKFKKDYYG